MEQFLSRFAVTVEQDGSESRHDVTLSRADFDRLGKGYPSPEDFVRACFEFLLEREPKERILASFDISEIGRHFHEFEQIIGR